jgi:hypothetical protein
MTLVIWVGVGMLVATGWVKVCCCTVIRPDDVAAMACICCTTQFVAAPMPRFGSVWLDKVCRVPNPASVWIVAWMRLESIARSRATRSREISGRWRGEAVPVVAALADVAWDTMGAATAVTAEADRNVRRLVPLRAETRLFSMP